MEIETVALANDHPIGVYLNVYLTLASYCISSQSKIRKIGGLQRLFVELTVRVTGFHEKAEFVKADVAGSLCVLS